MSYLHLWNGTGKKLFLFLIAGLPAFLFAIPLNYVFVEVLGLNKSLAYMIVLFVQVIINFFMCCAFVFKRDVSKSLISQFFRFVSGIFIARFFDWILYNFLVYYVEVYYLFVQLFNVLLFSLLKFKLAQQIVENRELSGF